MRWLRTLLIFDRGDVASSGDWQAIHESFVRAIQRVDHPAGAGELILRKKKMRPNKQWDRNGVVYLKARFISHLVVDEGWEPEATANLGEGRAPTEFNLFPTMEKYCEPITSEFGGFDFFTTAPNGTRVAIEWETGNISSSHRSMNKLAIALETGKLDAGVLIVPSRALYTHLTDRIGNIGELSGYLPMWKSLGGSVKKGLLAVAIVEHDHLTDDDSFPYLPRGFDGRAKEGLAK